MLSIYRVLDQYYYISHSRFFVNLKSQIFFYKKYKKEKENEREGKEMERGERNREGETGIIGIF